MDNVSEEGVEIEKQLSSYDCLPREIAMSTLTSV